ncbi:MAG: hypothetical protein VX589_09645 [Myxococcota bacterium]|nr:hypothetical protein [Myxococcota bacterium]
MREGIEMGDKPSWRDRDRKKDGDYYAQKDGRSGGRKAPRLETATANYKRQLDAFFDRGVVPEGLKGKLPAASHEGPNERQQLLRAIRDAKGSRPREKAFNKLLDGYDMPDEPDIWLLALEHTQDQVLRLVLTKIEEYLATGHPLPRKQRFIERLKGLEFTSFDPRVQTKAVALAGELRK